MKQKKVYLPASGASFSSKEAKALGQVIESIGESVTPQQLVEAAKDKRSPIHSLFEWDDSKAAASFRLEQARHHINHLRVKIIVSGKPENSKAYHSVFLYDKASKREERCYVPCERLWSSPELAEQVVGRAKSTLRAWKREYEQYRNLMEGPFQLVDEAINGFGDE